MVVAAGYLFDNGIRAHALLPLGDRMNPPVASLVVFLAASFLAYWYHRLVHHSQRLWRCVHQLHHSPTRIEALTAFYVHPLDGLLATLLNACVAYGIFGVGPEAAALALFYVTAFNLVAHADMSTPWWLGLFVQRPEMHRIHHERGAHRNNYGLPLWDMLFGTWRNPRMGEVACGFAQDKEKLIGQMLMMRDVDG